MSNKHPKGLYTLFFTEMWERLGFYLMVGILYLYIIDTERGGLGMSNSDAGEIYGTYLAFVYFTPFLGGMIADRFLGFRRAILFGGILMASGYFCLGVRSLPFFFTGLVLLCLGNGLFKPNISAMVGNLYAPGDTKRDAGFNIFYMGINIGASISALLAAPLRNLWSFNMAFTAAGVGLIVGTAILVFNWKKLGVADIRSEVGEDDFGMKKIITIILIPAAIFGALGYFAGLHMDFVMSTIGPITFAFLIGMLPIMAYFALLVLRAGPEEKPGLAALIPVYIAGGAFFMILHLSGGLMTVFAEQNTDRRAEWIPEATDFYAQKAMPSYFHNSGTDVPRPDKRTVVVVESTMESMFGARLLTTSVVNKLSSDPEVSLQVKVAESAPADHRFLTCKVYADDMVKISTEQDSHGVTSTVVRTVSEDAAPLKSVVLSRTIEGKSVPVLLVSQETFDAMYGNTSDETPTLGIGQYVRLVNAEMITALLNPVFVVLLTPLVVAFFAWRTRKSKPISTARKIFLGMVITSASIVIVFIAAYLGNDGAMKTSMAWLAFYYVVITVGELCLSPMGLSLVTKLSPKRLVGLMMGGWFLASAIGNKLSGFISGLEPTGTMFLILSVAILGVAGFIFALLPKLDAAIKKYSA